MSFGTRTANAPPAPRILATQTTLRPDPLLARQIEANSFDPQAIRVHHYSNDRSFANTISLPRLKQQSEGERVVIVLVTAILAATTLLAVYSWMTFGTFDLFVAGKAIVETIASPNA